MLAKLQTNLTRITQHRHNRKENPHTSGKTFLLHRWQSVPATVVECHLRWNKAQRLQAEKIWISKLDTRHPKGLNEF